jgi:alpha/beta superfamily hydrolase
MTAGARIESLFLEGPAGRIEATLKMPPPPHGRAAAQGTAGDCGDTAAVVCHPHPLFGGTLNNKVVHAIGEALVGRGVPVLRFNFRGVGRSGGAHDHGRGERDDLRAALDHLASRFPDRRLILTGYSFGAYVALAVGCEDPRAAALLGVAAPLGLFPFTFLRDCRKPLALVQGEADPLSPLGLALTLTAMLPGGGRVLPVAGANHAFTGRLDALRARLDDALSWFQTVRAEPA